MTTANSKPVEFVVLLFPPHGVPRVCEIPRLRLQYDAVQYFDNRADAEAALEKFLVENPEYRHWRDGSIRREGGS